MSDYRTIQTGIWDEDEWFHSLSSDGKLLFIYLFSNKLVSLAGIYKVPLSTIEYCTGIPREQVVELLQQFTADGKVFYENGVVWVINLRKFQANESPKVLQKIKNDLKLLSNTPLKLQYCAHYGYPIDTVSDSKSRIPYQYPIDTVSDSQNTLSRTLDTLSTDTVSIGYPPNQPTEPTEPTEHTPITPKGGPDDDFSGKEIHVPALLTRFPLTQTLAEYSQRNFAKPLFDESALCVSTVERFEAKLSELGNLAQSVTGRTALAPLDDRCLEDYWRNQLTKANAPFTSSIFARMINKAIRELSERRQRAVGSAVDPAPQEEHLTYGPKPDDIVPGTDVTYAEFAVYQQQDLEEKQRRAAEARKQRQLAAQGVSHD
jgi:hypothetical protein